jgi:hypothetical protein
MVIHFHRHWLNDHVVANNRLIKERWLRHHYDRFIGNHWVIIIHDRTTLDRGFLRAGCGGS